MRPLLLAALAALPLVGCSPTCTSEALSARLAALPEDQPGLHAAALAESCRVEDDLAAWLAAPDAGPNEAAWDAVCPDGPDAATLNEAPVLAHREALYQACDLSALELVDATTFARSEGPLALAVAVTHALRDNDKVDAETAAAWGRRLMTGTAYPLPSGEPIRVAVDAPEDPGAPDIVVTEAAVIIGDAEIPMDAVLRAPPTGPTGRGVQAIIDAADGLGDTPVLAVPADMPGELLARIAASVAPEGTVVLWTLATVDGEPHAPHGLRLGAPRAGGPSAQPGPGPGAWTLYDGATPRAPVDGCATPGPTLCATEAAPLDRVADALDDTETPTVAAHTVSAGDLVTLLQDVPGLALDATFEPCLAPPAGMTCVPGGPTLAGDATHAPGDAPTLVTLSTFYLDQAELSVAEYQHCVDEGACEAIRQKDEPDLPAEGLDFVQARAACSFYGKRLPTEWEWEKAARLNPPIHNDDGQDCTDRFHAGCGDAPRPTAHHGPPERAFFDLFGNVAEFTSTVRGVRGESCGARCEGVDPLGICDGAPMCKGRLSRVIRGGSYRRPASAATPTWRDTLRKTSNRPGMGVRCASDGPILDTLPAAWAASPPPAPEPPPALTDPQQAILAAIDEDRIDEIPECTDGQRGSSQTDCKDPTHYIYPNEDRGHVTYPYLVNRGGALLGVGSDQNYTFAALARSELVFLMDYDAIVVHIHRVNQAFIKHAETPDGFVALWDPANKDEAVEIIAKEWEGDPMARVYQRTLTSLHRIMHDHYTRTRAPSERGATSWLRDPAHYAWIRDLWRKGRIVTLKGDMLGPNAMQGVGEALHELQVPMRIYYTSNAPNAWGGEMTASYKRNVRRFPMDDDSVVLQALGWVNEFGQTGHWHFNVQNGQEVQDRLGRDGYVWLWQVVRPYRHTDDVDLTLSGIEGRWQDAHPPMAE